MIIQLFLFSFFLLVNSDGQTASKHRTKCEDSGFCTRQKSFGNLMDATARNSSFSLINAKKVGLGKLIGDVLNSETSVLFTMELVTLVGDVCRFRLFEKNIIYSKEIDKLVLPKNLEPVQWNSFTTVNGVSIIQFGENKIVIQHSPLFVKFFAGRNPVFEFNGRNYLKYEHRVKNQTREVFVPKELKYLQPKLSQSMFNETFDGFTDSKPNGPQSIGFDVSFLGIQNVYGIPDHATSFNLKSTRGPILNYQTIFSFDPKFAGQTKTLNILKSRISQVPFKLPGLIDSVVLTGEFDNWKQTILMIKGANGLFSAKLFIDRTRNWEFKFVVDGRWVVDGSQETVRRNGILNNIIFSNKQNFGYNEPYRLWNSDKYAFRTDSEQSLYGSVPFMVGHKQNQSIGLFWLNSSEMWIDINRQNNSTHTHWSSETGIIDLFILLGPTPKDVTRQFTALTGRPQLPQHFALGYHQSRYSYESQVDALAVNNGFDKNDIPYDVLWLDIGHTNRNRYFTFNKKTFPDPIEMQNKIAKSGNRKVVTIIDPHISTDPAYTVFQKATKADVFIKDLTGKIVFKGECWPGESSWIDYSNPQGRLLWSELFKFDNYKDSTKNLYTWNDMNEPSVFYGPESTMPKDAIHFGGKEHREIHNIYGMLQQRSTYKGHLLRLNNEDRPFVLTRSFFAGSQKYGAVWTGDNVATWEHYRISIPMLLTFGMTGVTFSGADVGGFIGNPSPQLLARWYQLGSFTPFFRGHSDIHEPRREPWLNGEFWTSIHRNAIKNRYRLLPYLYTMFFEAHHKGYPVMRPMMFEFPNHPESFTLEDQFMFGDSLLVKPVPVADVSSMDVWLPKTETWFDYWTLEKIEQTDSDIMVRVLTPIETIPVFIRGGSIIAKRESVKQSSAMMENDPIVLLIALDFSGNARGRLFTDDGKSFKNRDGEYIYVEFEAKMSGGIFSLRSKKITIDGWKESKFEGLIIERLVVTGVSGGGIISFNTSTLSTDSFVFTENIRK